MKLSERKTSNRVRKRVLVKGALIQVPREHPDRQKRLARPEEKSSRTGEVAKPSMLARSSAFTEAMLRNGTALEELSEARSKLLALRAGNREEFRRQLGVVLGAAQALAADKDQWIRLCRHSSWEALRNRPKTDDNDHLGWVLRFAVGMSTRTQRQRASKLSRALRKPFEERVQPEELPAYIKTHGGWQQMAADEAERTKRGKPKSHPAADIAPPPPQTLTAHLVGELLRKLHSFDEGTDLRLRVRIMSKTARHIELELVKPPREASPHMPL